MDYEQKDNDHKSNLNEELGLQFNLNEASADKYSILGAFFMQSLEGVFVSEMSKPIYWNDYADKEAALDQFFNNQKIIKVNNALLGHYRAGESDLLGKSPAGFYRHNLEQGKRVCREILEKETSIIISEERRIDGSILWTECNYIILKNNKGQITGTLGIQRDITNKIKDEEKFNNLLSALNLSKDSIVICDAIGKIIYANEATAQMLGHEVPIVSILGKEIFKIFKPKKKIQAIKGVLNIQNDGYLVNQESILVTQDGSEIPFELSSTLLKDSNENAIGYIVVSRDISERLNVQKELMQSEERYRNLFDNNPLPMFIFEPDTLNILSVNDEAIRLYGYTKEEFLSKTIADLRPEEDLEKLFKHIEFIKTNNDYNISKGWRHVKKDGTLIDVEVRAQNVLYNGKNVRIAAVIDITADSVLQNKLSESEKSFRGVFNSLNDAIFIQNKDGVFLDVNSGAEIMYGYKHDEFIGRTPEFLAAPGKNDFGQLVKNIQMTFKGGGPFTFEFWGLRKRGEIFPKEIMINKGTYFGQEAVIMIARDITTRKANELSLAKSENNLRAVFNNISDAIIIHDFNGNIIEVNDRTLEMYQISKEQSTQLNIKDISADSDLLHGQLSKAFSLVQNGHSLLFEWQTKIPHTGDLFDVEVSLRKSIWSSKEVAFAVIRNITERKKVEKALIDSEESYKGLFNSINDAIYIQNDKGEFLDVNCGAEMMYGYRREEFIKQTPDFLTAPNKNDLPKVFGLIQNTFETGASNKFDFWGLRKNGEIFPKEVLINKGKYLGQDCLIAIARDISDRKIIEDSLKDSEQKLREINLMKDKFFSIIAHDLRSPFQGLIGIANILVEDDELTLEDRIILETKLYEGLKSQFNLLDILLTWNRLQRGVLEFNPGMSSLNKEIEIAAEVLKSAIEKKNLTVLYDVEESIEFEFDNNMIATSIRNFLSNAVKFTRDNGTIKISAKEKEEMIIFEVTDNGIGMSENEISKLFRIDIQFTKRGTHDEGGTGLGLILCKEFIEKHNGKIQIVSEVNRGSTFRITLPKFR